MIRCSEIIEKPIFKENTNSYFSMVHDVILSKDTNSIIGFTWKKKLLKKEYGLISLDDLFQINRDGLYLKNQNNLKEFNYNNKSYLCLSYIYDILNKIVLNSNGELIGIIRDIMLDIEDGKYKGFEMSEGYIDDIISGRKLIGAGFGYKIDSNALMLYDNSLIMPQGRGLININKFT